MSEIRCAKVSRRILSYRSQQLFWYTTYNYTDATFELPSLLSFA